MFSLDSYAYSLLSLFTDSVISTFGLRGGKLTAAMLPLGQTSTHLRQSLHLSALIYANVPRISIASNGHSLRHF